MEHPVRAMSHTQVLRIGLALGIGIAAMWLFFIVVFDQTAGFGVEELLLSVVLAAAIAVGLPAWSRLGAWLGPRVHQRPTRLLACGVVIGIAFAGMMHVWFSFDLTPHPNPVVQLLDDLFAEGVRGLFFGMLFGVPFGAGSAAAAPAEAPPDQD